MVEPLFRFKVEVWYGETEADARLDQPPARTFHYVAATSTVATRWAEGQCWELLKSNPGMFWRAVATRGAVVR